MHVDAFEIEKVGRQALGFFVGDVDAEAGGAAVILNALLQLRLL